MHEGLRPHLADAARRIERVARQSQAGYRLLAAWDGDAVIGLAGYRPEENLIYGRFMYVDDLVVAASDRRGGIGARLLDAVRDEWPAVRTSRPWCWTRPSTTASPSVSTFATGCWREACGFRGRRADGHASSHRCEPARFPIAQPPASPEASWCRPSRRGRARAAHSCQDVGVDPAAPIDADYVEAMHAHAAGTKTAGVSQLALSEQLIGGSRGCRFGRDQRRRLHNYTVPASLKAWMDRVVRIGRTFASTPAGKVGSLADRPTFVVAASGGYFSEGILAPARFLHAVSGCGIRDHRHPQSASHPPAGSGARRRSRRAGLLRGSKDPRCHRLRLPAMAVRRRT